jgi:predicted ribosomally synthesized peptide with SipW-like signal peptide
MSTTSKKKSLTIVLAIALVAALAVTGTLMLFTATSDTATNVVTMGNIKPLLQEYDGTDNKDYQTIGTKYDTADRLDYGRYKNNGTFTGIKFDGSMPGDTYTKKPRVKNDGDNDFYTAVYGKVTFTKGKKALGWGEITDLINDTLIRSEIEIDQANMSDEDYQAFKNYAFLNLVLTSNSGINDEWYAAPITAKHAEFYGTWYYIDKDNLNTQTIKLKALEPGNTTPDIFQNITIPEELSDLAQGVTISLDMFAFAVQSDNIDESDITISSTDPVSTSNWEEFFGNAGK